MCTHSRAAPLLPLVPQLPTAIALPCPACDSPSSRFPGSAAGQASGRALCAAPTDWPFAETGKVLPLPAVTMSPGKGRPRASPSTQSPASLPGSSETRVVHWGLASTSPVTQHTALPCISSSVILAFGCHTLAADMFVLVSLKDSPKQRNKKETSLVENRFSHPKGGSWPDMVPEQQQSGCTGTPRGESHLGPPSSGEAQEELAQVPPRPSLPGAPRCPAAPAPRGAR